MGKLFVWKGKVLVVVFSGLVGFLLAGSPLLAQEQNLIKNPSFEEGKGEKDGLAKDWNASYSAGKYETFLDTEEKVEGKFSQRLHSITDGLPQIYQAVPVKPKTTYYLSAYFKSDSSSARCGLKDKLRGGKGPSSVHSGNREWKQVFLKLNSGDSELVYVIFILAGKTENANLWVDKVKLVEESPEIAEAYKKYISKIDFSISVKAEPNAVKSGESFVVTAKFSTGVGEEAAGYTLRASALAVPEKCENLGRIPGVAPQWEFHEHKIAKYSFYTIIPYKWFGRMSGEDLPLTFTVNTKEWPEGDYRLSLKMCLYKGGKDFYRGASFLLSVHE